MSNYSLARKNTLVRSKILSTPIKVSEFDEDEEDEASWQERARRLQIRRWRKINRRES